MTSSNGNSFRATGPLCGEFTSPRWINPQRPVTQSFHVFFDLRLNKRLSKQSWGWWFETSPRPLWRHCSDYRLYTETEMSSFWWNFHHWLHWKLSKWQLPVQPMIKISSKWRHFRFSVSACPRVRVYLLSRGSSIDEVFADEGYFGFVCWWSPHSSIKGPRLSGMKFPTFHRSPAVKGQIKKYIEPSTRGCVEFDQRGWVIEAIATWKQYHNIMDISYGIRNTEQTLLNQVYRNKPWYTSLTHWDLVTPYGNIDLGQHWLR